MLIDTCVGRNGLVDRHDLQRCPLGLCLECRDLLNKPSTFAIEVAQPLFQVLQLAGVRQTHQGCFR
jgi:hypothetical protein